MREFYSPCEGETKQARCEAAIRKVMTSQRRMGQRELRRVTHGYKYGIGLWDNSLAALCKAGELRKEVSDTGKALVILLKEKD
jgi:hypothetical protein